MEFVDPISGQHVVRKLRRRENDPRDARELTFTCFRRYPFLSSDRTRTWFIEALQAERERFSFDLWAYVIMPEHVHLLVRPRDECADAGEFVGKVKEKVGRQAVAFLKRCSSPWLNRIAVREGSRLRHRFWQAGGGYDRNIDRSQTLNSSIDYIHANPVRRGLVERPEDWKWSSAAWYAGKQVVPLAMDRTLPEIG